jgi:hypothetical protein
VTGPERKRPRAWRQLRRKKQGLKKKHGDGTTVDETDEKTKRKKERWWRWPGEKIDGYPCE